MKFYMKIRNFLVSISIIGLLAYSLWIIFFNYNPELEKAISSFGMIILEFLVAFFGFTFYYQKHLDIRLRRGWLFLSLAALSYVIAQSLWYYFETILRVNPFPSTADYFYLLFYPLTLIGVLLLPYKPLKRSEFLIYFFDISIVMIAVIMVFWHFILAPMQLSFYRNWKDLIAIAYPIGDLLLFTAVTVMIQRNLEKISRWVSVFILISVLFSAVPDSFFAYYELNGISYNMIFLNVFWFCSAFCMLLAIRKQMAGINVTSYQESHFSNRSQRLLRTTLPYLAAATGPSLLVGVINSSYTAGVELHGLLIGTIILVALVLGRQHIVLMDNIHLYEETHKLAITDSLTGLYNRHYFNEVLQKEIERTRRYKKDLSILLIDIDNFKTINDTFGHLKGDGVLKIIAGLLTEQIRQMDILARFGGDEFVVILPETDIAGAMVAAQKIEHDVSKHSFANTTLSVSIGAASFKPIHSAEQFLEEADRQLYKNKQAKYPDRDFSASVLFV